MRRLGQWSRLASLSPDERSIRARTDREGGEVVQGQRRQDPEPHRRCRRGTRPGKGSRHLTVLNRRRPDDSTVGPDQVPASDVVWLSRNNLENETHSCHSGDVVADSGLTDIFKAVTLHLADWLRRLLYGAHARSQGWGGVSQVAETAGVSRTTVVKGMEELEQPPPSEELPRSRRPGGGCKPAQVKD